MCPRIPLVSVLCAVLFGAFGQIAASAADGGSMAAITTIGILSDTNFQAVLHSLQQRDGVEKLGEPEVVSTFGRGFQQMRTDYILQQTQYTSVTLSNRDNIYRKLDSIRLDKTPDKWADGISLIDALRFVNKQSKLLDPDKNGINFLYNPNVEAGIRGGIRIDPATGIPIGGGGGGIGESVDGDTIIVKLSMRDVSLRQLLNAVVLVADRPIEYSVEDFGVVFSAIRPDSEPRKIETRLFKMDTNTIIVAMRKIAGSNIPLETNSIPALVKSYFTALGLDLTAPGRTVDYRTSRVGWMLFVRATPAELDFVEREIGKLNEALLQIHIKARLVKLSQADADAILTAGIAVDTKATNTVEILTDAKATPLLRKLESRGGMETLGEPEVVTITGRQVQMRSGNSTVDLTPILLEDGHAIHLQPTISAPETLTAQANVWDNQTLILASNNPGADKTRLLVFITATVVDPAGNRVYSDENSSRFNPPTEIPRQEIRIPTPSP